ncbi:DUF6458 family protein [Streptomyces sp. NPDC039028]|uniref:DUF6458 family protein n=1 Tax=Streptomyces sp. NPDC039028 TaxID=3155370 RepID=UPI00340644F4
MGLGVCIILIAVGAILTFASDWEIEGINLDLVGLILMAVGIIGTAVYTSILRMRRPPCGRGGGVRGPRRAGGRSGPRGGAGGRGAGVHPRRTGGPKDAA